MDGYATLVKAALPRVITLTPKQHDCVQPGQVNAHCHNTMNMSG